VIRIASNFCRIQEGKKRGMPKPRSKKTKGEEMDLKEKEKTSILPGEVSSNALTTVRVRNIP
jgi:hypothetical protein